MNKLISFEGVNGAGKSYQIEKIHHWLIINNLKVTKIHQPGYTEVGQQIRNLLLNYQLDLKTELLLFAADRTATHPHIINALNKGDIVLCDRYTDSTIAFQGYGRGMNINVVHTINKLATNLVPELTFLFDIDPQVGLLRKGNDLDQIEKEDLSFHNKVRAGYLTISESEPNRVVVINANQPKEDITEFIKQQIQQKLNIYAN
jgi:dTMP kinase